MTAFFRSILLLLFCVCSVPTFAEQNCQFDGIQATTPNDRFILDAGVATDKQTGLMWQRCFVGQSGEVCRDGELRVFSWPAALQYAALFNEKGGFQSYKDWRLPNARELLSIGEVACVHPALNTHVFPSAPSQRVWSSSPYKFYPHYSWFVDFSNLRTSHLERFKKYPIILVRNAYVNKQ